MTKGSGPQRSSWKKSTRSTAPSATSPNGYGAGDFGSRGRDRRNLLFQVSALFTLAIGLCVIMAIYLRHRPYLEVPLIYAGVSESKLRSASDPLFAPPNPFAAEDAKLLGDRFGNRANQQLIFVGTPSGQSGTMAGTTDDAATLVHTLTRHFSTITPGGPGGDMIAMFVTAQGIVDAENDEPYLIVGDSRADDPTTWVPFRSLLAGIKTSLEGNRSNLSNARVVLFLDAARGATMWDWGNFESSFSGHCRDVASQIAPDRIAVITSCADQQRSWWDPRRGQSLFARAATQALSGEADIDGNGVINVKEISEYVSEQVAIDARAIWAADQTPELLSSSAAGWRVIRQPDSVEAPPTIDADLDRLEKDFNRIDDLWTVHAEVARLPHPPLVTMPLAWSVLEKQLARLELLALAGDGYRGEFDRLASGCQTLLLNMQSGSAVLPKQSDLPESVLYDYFHGSEPDSPGEPVTLFDEFAAAWKKNPSAEKVSVPPGIDEAQVIDVLWPWLIENDWKSESLGAAAELIDQWIEKTSPPVQLLETHLIRLMTAPDLSAINSERVAAVVGAHRASRDAILTPDLRASFWIRNRLKQLDESRMTLTDVALSRGTSIGAEERLRRLADNDYVDLRHEGQQISEAYRWRDQSLHEIPRLIETLLGDVNAFASDERNRGSIELFRDATAAVRCLVSELRLTDDTSRGVPLSLRDAAGEMEVTLKRLRQRVGQRVGAVTVRAAGDESGLRQAFALLRGTGVNDPGQRSRLHQRMISLLRSDAGDLQTTGRSQANSTEDETARDVGTRLTIDGRQAWTHWLEQTGSFSCGPVIESEDTASEAEAETIRDQGNSIRQKVSQLERTPSIDAAEQASKLAAKNAALAAVRRDAEDRATVFQSQTVLLTGPVAQIEQATENRFKLDLQLFAMDCASRTLDEFWCEARLGEAPYFPTAADRLLAFESFPLSVRKLDSVDLATRAAQASSVANGRDTLVARPAGDLEAGALLETVRTRPVPFVMDRPNVLPAGRLSVWTTYQSPLLPTGDSQTETLSTELSLPPEITSTDDRFPVHTFFRGLRRTGGLDIKHLGNGRVTLFRLAKYDRPKVVVKSDAEAAEKVVIVLDCSASMTARNRLDTARNALREYLRSLAKTKSSVGLVMFGHRYGWEMKDDYLVQDKAAKGEKFKVITYRNQERVRLRSLGVEESADHHPDFDVEVVVDLAELTDRHLNQLESAIGRANAVGVTPTYQAIDKAYEVLGASEGHIVVLTDGVPLLTGQRPSDFRSSARSKFSSRGKSVRLSIVNFDNSRQQTELLNDFPGTVINAQSSRDLSEALQNTIDQTVVVWKRDGQIASEQVELDTNVSIDRWPPPDSEAIDGRPVRPAKTYSIDAIRRYNNQRATTKVQVEGGEEFQLRVSGNSLLHLPFPKRDHITDDLRVTSNSPNKYFVYALAPDRNNNRELTLRLVIQNQQVGAFTPRPTDVWMDLVGTNSEGNRTINHSLNLPEFEPGHGVPVVLARIKDWPDWAVHVQIEASMRFSDNAAAREPLALVSNQNSRIESIPDVVFRVEQSKLNGHAIKVTETHPAGRIATRLRLLPSPLPDEASVSTYSDDGLVVHEFRYNEPQDAPEVFVTPQKTIMEDASIVASSRQPIVVLIDGR